MNGTPGALTRGLKRLRANPALSAPVTFAVRGTSRALGVTPEFAVKHLPRSGVAKMTLPNGCRASLWSKGDDWVSNQVFWRGWDGYEPEVARLYWRLATQAAVTIDVGAHVGYYTILAAKANPAATVIAFEPLPAAFSRLQRNVRMNRLENVVTRNEAAGALNGVAEFFHVPGAVPSSSSLSESFMRGTADLTSTPVRVVRIDTVFQTRQLDSIDLVKLDTETTEPQVLAGMGGLLAERRPDIICEVLTRADVSALHDILTPLGYEFYLLTDGGPRRSAKIVPHERWLNYHFAPGT